MLDIERYENFEVALAELARLHGFLLCSPAGQTFWPTYNDKGVLDHRIAVEFEDVEGKRGRLQPSNTNHFGE